MCRTHVQCSKDNFCYFQICTGHIFHSGRCLGCLCGSAPGACELWIKYLQAIVPEQQLVAAFISLLLLLLLVTEVKVSEMAQATAWEAPARFKFCRGQEDKRGRTKAVYKLLGSQIPTELPIASTVNRQTLLFSKEFKLPGQTGAKAEAGPKNISLPQKCPRVLSLPKECLLVRVSTHLLRAEGTEMVIFGLLKGFHVTSYFSVP